MLGYIANYVLVKKSHTIAITVFGLSFVSRFVNGFQLFLFQPYLSTTCVFNVTDGAAIRLEKARSLVCGAILTICVMI